MLTPAFAAVSSVATQKSPWLRQYRARIFH